ncbi:MAG: threonylcarbamoyl-AMP synthase [Dehalococcoidia bacterium]|nr:threonylcarbamoyl-AMP synthase [Dehalococcoidia bacterium]
MSMRTVLIDAPGALDEAARVLRSGGIVAFPTDTVYGLAAVATDAAACAKLWTAKGRPSERAIPLFIPSLDALNAVAVVNDVGRKLAQRYWPGPLTIVFDKAQGFESAALAGGQTVAVRVPDHPAVLALVRLVGAALAVTSANKSGGPNPRTAAEVESQLGDAIDLLLDGGPCASDIPSTIVDVTVDPPAVLREGAARL